jgi:hypothetical protein
MKVPKAPQVFFLFMKSYLSLPVRTKSTLCLSRHWTSKSSTDAELSSWHYIGPKMSQWSIVFLRPWFASSEPCFFFQLLTSIIILSGLGPGVFPDSHVAINHLTRPQECLQKVAHPSTGRQGASRHDFSTKHILNRRQHNELSMSYFPIPIR